MGNAALKACPAKAGGTTKLKTRTSASHCSSTLLGSRASRPEKRLTAAQHTHRIARRRHQRCVGAKPIEPRSGSGCSGIREQAPGKHWHQTITNRCVGRGDLLYREQCNDTHTVCEDVWVTVTPNYAKCWYTNETCNIRAYMRHKNDRPYFINIAWNYYWFYQKEVEQCREEIIP